MYHNALEGDTMVKLITWISVTVCVYIRV